MGGGPSKMTLISRLKNRDNDVAMVRQRVASVTQQRDELQRKLAKIRDEMTLIDETLGLEKDINNRNSTIDELLFRKGELEEELVDTQLLLLSVNKALEQIEKYNNTQTLTKLFYDDEFKTLYSKVIKRQKLKYKDYNNRNRNLIRLSNKLKSKYSNDLRNSEYQDDHNRYFMTLNSIFWWVYYILFIIITYQIIYIQTDITLISKIVIILILGLYPLLHRMYDLVIMKI